MRITSTPREVTPAAKAVESSGELGRMSWPMTMPGLPSGMATTSAKAAPIASATCGDSWSGTMPRTS